MPKRVQVLHLRDGDTFILNRQRYIVTKHDGFGGGAAVINIRTGVPSNFSPNLYVVPTRFHILTDEQLKNYVEKKIKEHEKDKVFQREQAERTDW